MAHTMRIRKGDLVHILSGKDRGKQGRVIDARPKDKKVIVENLNLVKRHTKPRPIQNTSRMVVCPVCNRPTRVGMKEREDHGALKKVRVCKRVDCGEEIDR